MNYREIGYRIQMAREELGLNQKDLAEKLGISQSSLSNYEKGKRRLYLADLQKIAQALEKPTDYFLQPIEPAASGHTYGGNEELSDFVQIIKEMAELSREDRKSVYNYVKWLKQNKTEGN
jgi:transcriptional regulator with XRE-family HTH domain